MQQLKKRTEGFTIIEVMIVLVIAAVILLIVFLAVPALQRNSRNTQRRSEAASLLAAVSEFAGNKSGTLPTDSVSSCGASCDAKDIYNLAGSPKNITTLTVEGSGGTTASTITSAVVRKGTVCDTTTQLPTTTGASSRSFSLLFHVEASGNNITQQCQSS